MSKNILIVDDSVLVRAMIIKCFGLAEIEVGQLLQAGHGKEALEVLADNPVDLIFTDINMPEMNGIELIEHLSKDDHLSSIPIAVVSTEGSQSRIDELKQMGVKAYLRKPFTPESIKEIVTNLIGG